MLAPKPGERYIDATFGAGGYSRALLEAADCQVLALDRDPNAISEGRALEVTFAPRLKLIETAFSKLVVAVGQAGWDGVDGIVFDLGVSSMQLDAAERGFSFMRDGPLDMRMSQSGPSAADIVNTFPQEDIANILYTLGEERKSRLIAAAIVKDRAETPFETTTQLADLVARLLGRRPSDTKHPATRTFQALRLYVNDELGELKRALEDTLRLLRPGGRLAVVTFHSLEDRIVKQFITQHTGKQPSSSRYIPPIQSSKPALLVPLDKYGATPGPEEVALNPRARSARLRGAIRSSVNF